MVPMTTKAIVVGTSVSKIHATIIASFIPATLLVTRF